MKIVTIVGARPQFIKAAPLSKALAAAGIPERLVDSGQHYDHNMAGNFFDELGLPEPAYSLGVGSGPHGQMTGRILESIEKVLLQEPPTAVVVFGDTNTTLAGALAAAKLHVPVVHIEAGLRSYNNKMPEEINRRLTDQISKILFCPSKQATDNLAKEGFTNIRNDGELLSPEQCATRTDFTQPVVCNVGDIMYDALIAARDRNPTDSLLDRFRRRSYVLVTIHRAESTDNQGILGGLVRNIVELGSVYDVIFPVHPRTRQKLSDYHLDEVLQGQNIHCIDPLPYGAFVKAQSNALAVVTDSGGVQKESFMLGTPCLTLRDETEWTETVALGRNRLLGKMPASVLEAVRDFETLAPLTSQPYGDGHAAERIAGILHAQFA